MALLVEGLGGGGDTTIEEYMIEQDNELRDNQDHAEEEEKIKLYGAEEGQSWVAKPVRGHSTLGMVSRTGSMATQSMSFMDPLVTLFGSVHEKLPEMGSMPSMLFSTTGSMFIVAEQPGNEQWDEESLQKDGSHENSDASGAESDDNLQSPLLSRQATNAEKEVGPTSKGSFFQGNAGEAVSGVGIGGGWQLAYKWSGKKGEDGKKELKRIYLHQENAPGSHRGSVLSLSGFDVPAEGEVVHASAIVSQSVLRLDNLPGQHSVGAALAQAPKSAGRGSSWGDLLEPGVKHALIVGVGIQILQQVR